MSRAGSFIRSITDLRVYAHAFRLAHFSAYSHVRQVGRLDRGSGVSFAPNVSFRDAERITIGAGTHIGERSVIWAGDSTSSITFGEKCLLAPNVTVTASNYGIEQGIPVMDQQKVERDIVIGRDVWLGAERRRDGRRHHRRRRGGRRGRGRHEGPPRELHRRGRAGAGHRPATGGRVHGFRRGADSRDAPLDFVEVSG